MKCYQFLSLTYGLLELIKERLCGEEGVPFELEDQQLEIILFDLRHLQDSKDLGLFEGRSYIFCDEFNLREINVKVNLEFGVSNRP